jgi:hypothetical protein
MATKTVRVLQEACHDWQTQGKLHKPKWKAIAAKLLKANGGVLKLKTLQSGALKSAQLPGNPSKAALRADMLAKVCRKAAEDAACLLPAMHADVHGGALHC